MALKKILGLRCLVKRAPGFYCDEVELLGFFIKLSNGISNSRLVPGWVDRLHDLVHNPTNATFGVRSEMGHIMTITCGPIAKALPRTVGVFGAKSREERGM